MNKSRLLIILLWSLCGALFSSLTQAATVLTGPDRAENGGVVPVSLENIGPQLIEGETATINSADGTPVITVSVTDDVTIDSFRTSIIMPETGTISGDVFRLDGVIEHAEKEIIVTIGTSPPDEGDPYTGIKILGELGRIRMQLSNDQALVNFVERVVVTMPEQGSIIAEITPWISRNSFFEFTGNFDATNATVDITTASTVVPVPAAIWLFGSGLLGLVGMARRKKAA